MKSKFLLLCFLLFGSVLHMQAQVTTSMIRGKVTDDSGAPLPGAIVEAVHVPSGTEYGVATQNNGTFSIPGMRVGGPYTIIATYVGFETKSYDNVYLSLGVTTDFAFSLAEKSLQLGEIVISGASDPIFSSERTGAATSINKAALESMPTISRRINDFTRLTPQSSGSSFAGQDNRLNNITVDGSYFNNSFGLAGQPGDRTGVSPISLDAIEQIQVNIAPYDVRQANFIGAGVNTVTRSGTNEFSGSAWFLYRDQSLVGTKAKDRTFNPGTFNYNQFGFRLGGPIIKDKLFFFANYEQENQKEPGTTFRANNGGEEVGGNVTRVLGSDLDSLSNFLRTNFEYETGPYQDYQNGTNASKFLIKLDYNLNKRNKISLRYNQLDSDTDVLLSNSSSLGFGSRRTNLNGLNFQNSNYKILENIRSLVGEWNSTFGGNMSNNLIVGYTFQDESRGAPSDQLFPLVDILKDGAVYTTFGYEPFTPNNELRYKTLQLQNNFNIYTNNHTITLGLSLERYESENVFFPGSQSAYVYNSLEDFYADANDYLQNPDRTVSPVSLNRFQVRWSNIPGQTKPVQPLEVFYAGIYGQDQWRVSDKLNITAGLRVDVPFFGNTAERNPEVDSLNFRDENGNQVQYATDKLPDANLLWSPRIGFNYDLNGSRTTQIRGGTGIFTSRPAYVWVSNQIGNNGILTGFERVDNTTDRPFNPDIDHYKPESVTGAPASRYELALTDPGFRFPQIWRTNLAVDQKLPYGMIGTIELLYSTDVNGIYYINANLGESNTTYSGVDDRERWTTNDARRINSKIDNAVVLKNQNVGSSYNFAASLERPFQNGLFFKLGYSYGITRNTVDPGSIAFGSWNTNPHAGNPNNPGIGFSLSSMGHRTFAAATYKIEYSDFGATTFSLFFDGFNLGNGSYRFSGDVNGDGGNGNDLIYIPKDKSEMNFETYTSGSGTNAITFTAEDQATAWEAFIEQDNYLSKNRGSYAERGAAFLPMVFRADLSVAQDFYINVGGKRNSLQLRVDIFNFTNLLSRDWGVGKTFTTQQPLIARGADAEGKSIYRLQNFGGQLISQSFQNTAFLNDVFRIQVGVRYTFN